MRRTIGTFIFVALLSAVVYPLFPAATYTIGNLLQLYFLILAVLKFYSAHFAFPDTDVQRKTWFLMAAGAFLWMLAQMLEWYCEAVLKLVAYGTVADCFWLLGYLPFWMALISQVREFQNPISRKQRTAMYVRTALPLLAAFVILFLTVMKPQITDSSQGWFERTLDFSYPVFDLTLLFLSAILWQTARLQKSHTTPWLLIGVASAITTIGDLVLSTITDFDSMMYITIDIYYFSTYFFLALAGESAALGAAVSTEQQKQK